MDISVNLKNNNGFSWYETKFSFVKGYAFYEGKLYQGDNFNYLFKDVDKYDEFKDIIRKLNGVFSVVIKNTNSVFLASDLTRTFPVFYSLNENNLRISDDASVFTDSQTLMDQNSIDEFKAAGFVTGSKTLLKGVYQIEAGQTLLINKKCTQRESYWTYKCKPLRSDNISDLKEELKGIYSRIAHRIAEVAKGKTLLIPLSGGYDSRLVACLVKDIGYKNVICFTYGRESCFEAKRSKRVAKELGLEWFFVPYNDKIIARYFSHLKLWDEYTQFASNYSSIPHIQDFIAIAELKAQKAVPSDSILLPGHSGDIFAGTHIPKNIDSISSLADCEIAIHKKHFQYESFKLPVNFEDGHKPYYSAIETWSWKERQAKFIINSVRCYEFFDYKFMLPLWDKELAEFFRAIPLEYKNRFSINSYDESNNLYDLVATELFSKYGVNYKKRFYENFLPRVLCKVFGWCQYKDCINFSKFTQYLVKGVKHKSINAKVIKYTLSKLVKN